MALTREKKETIVHTLRGVLKDAKSVAFVHFRGLTVAASTALRRKLRSKGIEYQVVKKTLLKKALQDFDLGTLPQLKGEISLAYGLDPIMPIKSMVEAAKEKDLKESIAILGAIFEGKYINIKEVNTLALIPSREVLLGQLATVINGPIQNTVGVLHNTIRSFVVALNQIAQLKN